MANESAEVPGCPGCHFGCAVDDYQCARGGRFFQKWQDGEEIPVRRPPWERDGRKGEGEGGPGRGPRGEGGPGPGAGAGGAGGPGHGPGGPRGKGGPGPHAGLPAGVRIKMLLTMAGAIMRDREDAERDKRVAECIFSHDGSATNRIIAERTKLSDADIDEQIAALEAQGVVQSRTLEDGRCFHDLTDTGRDQAKAWADEHRDADVEFFGALTDEEADQLESLLAKALKPHMRRH